MTPVMNKTRPRVHFCLYDNASLNAHEAIYKNSRVGHTNAGGLFGTEIVSDHDKYADFRAYRTFSVCLSDPEPGNEHAEYDNAANRALVKQAVESEMSGWYTQNDSVPDLMAGFRIIIKDKKLTYMNCRDGDNYSTWPECRLETHKYTEGTLVIYVTDTRKGQVIWQASATGALADSPGGDEKLIRRTVSALFDEFPFHPK